MAKNGFKIFDSDTHVGPYVDILERYLTAQEKERLKAWEPYKRTSLYAGQGGVGHVTYARGERKYARRLRQVSAEDSLKGYNTALKANARERPISLHVDDDPAERLKDMDYEGVDVNFLLPSGWFGTWTSGDDVTLEAAMYRAYHEWMNDYCGRFPERLGGLIICCGRDVEGSVAEIQRWGKARWPWGVLVYTPAGFPLDHPALEPIWKATAEHDLAVTLHTFTSMPPYAPGGLDTWENLFIQRSAAHPWCGMRNMAALIGAGLMDRYPTLRIGPLEAGHGWLPFWMKRLDEHAHTVKG
ncbi:MAG: amidohydrolase family protein, partial [Burkholderiales bacterium]